MCILLLHFIKKDNNSIPIQVTLLGIVISVNDIQFRNAHIPIRVTLLGIFISFNDVQSLNAQ